MVAYFFKLMKKDEFDARTGEPPKADKDTPIAVEPAPGSADPATGSSSAADEELKEEDAEDYEADEAVGDATSHSTCD